MKNIPSLKSQASAIFIGNLIGTVFQFLIPAIIVRLISQEDFGVFRQFSLVAGTFTSLLGMGYASSLFYFYPITDAKGKQKIIQQTELLFLINILIFLSVFYFYGDRILIYLNFKEFLGVKDLIALYIIFELLSLGISFIFTLEKNTLLNKIYPPIEKVVKFLIFLVLVFLVPGFKGPILALIVFAAAKLIYFLIHIYPYLAKIHRVDLKLMKNQLLYSLPFGFALILNIVSSTFDKFFINQYITPKDYAIYSVAFLSIPILKQFFQSIHNVVVPEISLMMSKNRIEKATELWQKTVDKTSSVTIPAVILFWILAKEIITILYTIEYIEAANYYRIFILMFLVSMFSHEIILRGSNNTRFIFISSFIGTLLTIILGFVIIPKFGLYGAIITALVGTITPMIISLHFERKIMQRRISNWVNWRKIGLNLLICLMVGLPILLLKDYISNIYLRGIVSGSIFLFFVILIQIKLDLFIFTQYIPIIKKKIGI